MKKFLLVAMGALVLTACGGGSKEGVAECEKVSKDILATVEKANNPAMADAVKKQLETAKAEWAKVEDQKQLAQTCKTAGEQMKAALANMPK